MREHRDMINLCRSREFDKAAHFLRGHIETVREDLLTVIDRYETAAAPAQ
jgi:DNA-binding GntR family transcriptional regulator